MAVSYSFSLACGKFPNGCGFLQYCSSDSALSREMAVGNTFGATALSSYGGFWISFAIVLTPGGFEIMSSIETAAGPKAFLDSFGFFLMVSFTPR